jgi:multicomponent Na+:H+ antiporter subunit G
MEAVANITRDALGGVICALGLACVLTGAVGALRFPDFYTRLHAARVSDGVGFTLSLLGLAILSGDWAIAARLLLLAALALAVAPLLSHLAANAAHSGGLAPLVGRYRAPRPGARRGDS